MAPFSKQQQQLIQTFLYLLIISLPIMHSQSTTSFTYDSFARNPTTLLYQGDAHVPLECTFLRLTDTNGTGYPAPRTVGRVLYSKPVQFRDSSAGLQADFQTTIKFFIKPGKANAADGLAFFIAPVGTAIPSGAVGGNLAIYDPSGASSTLVAVELDTYVNPWDPSYRHIGLNYRSRVSSKTTRFDSGTGDEVTARITYVAETGTISVVASTCYQNASLSNVYNLRNILPDQVQVGISSAAGAGIHDITYWSFTSTLVSTGRSTTNNHSQTSTPQYVSM